MKRPTNSIACPSHGAMKRRGMWSIGEHDRFLQALKLYPRGPWRAITAYVGTRSIRQVQTHAQKYQEQCLERLSGSCWDNSLQLRREHRIELDMLQLDALIHTPSASTLVENPLSPVAVHKLHDLSPMMEIVKANDMVNKGKDKETGVTMALVSDLPSLNESLDFFIANFSFEQPM